MLRATCINDLVDIWNTILATHRPSPVEFLKVKLIPRGEGSQRGPRAFKQGHLITSLEKDTVELEVAYDEQSIVSSINRNVDFWTGRRMPEGPPLYGIRDCR